MYSADQHGELQVAGCLQPARCPPGAPAPRGGKAMARGVLVLTWEGGHTLCGTGILYVSHTFYSLLCLRNIWLEGKDQTAGGDPRKHSRAVPRLAVVLRGDFIQDAIGPLKNIGNI